MYSFELYATIISPHPIYLMFEINPKKIGYERNGPEVTGEGGKSRHAFFLQAALRYCSLPRLHLQIGIRDYVMVVIRTETKC